MAWNKTKVMAADTVGATTFYESKPSALQNISNAWSNLAALPKETISDGKPLANEFSSLVLRGAVEIKSTMRHAWEKRKIIGVNFMQMILSMKRGVFISILWMILSSFTELYPTTPRLGAQVGLAIIFLQTNEVRKTCMAISNNLTYSS